MVDCGYHCDPLLGNFNCFCSSNNILIFALSASWIHHIRAWCEYFIEPPPLRRLIDLRGLYCTPLQRLFIYGLLKGLALQKVNFIFLYLGLLFLSPKEEDVTISCCYCDVYTPLYFLTLWIVKLYKYFWRIKMALVMQIKSVLKLKFQRCVCMV